MAPARRALIAAAAGVSVIAGAWTAAGAAGGAPGGPPGDAGVAGTVRAADAPANELPATQRRSGIEFTCPETQAMQRDDATNPGMLWVLDGRTRWERREGDEDRSCASCHGDVRASMRGVAARYPAFDAASGRVVDLATRIGVCRERRQRARELAPESDALLALVTLVAHQSRGMATAPPDDTRVEAARARGRALFERRIGQLDLSCAQCHDALWGRRLGPGVISQAHPGGYPVYRFEWQALGSLQRRFRNCMTGVRAEPYPYGSQEFIDLEAFLQWRGRGLPIETPGVRP